MSQAYQRYQILQNATNLACREAEGWNELIESVLSKVVLSTIKRYQQKLNVGVQDSISDLLDIFKQKVTEVVFETVDTWRSVCNTEITLYPRGCRFCYSRGNSTIIVIEQDPQVRSFMMSDGLLGLDRRQSSTSTNIALAIPYSIFFLNFKRGVFSNLYYAWRNRTLESLQDPVCRPILPNIHENLNVCLGHTIPSGSLAHQTNEVLNYFWSSQFNSDLSTHWWNKGSIDSRLLTARAWSNLSKDDPMFILDVPFQRYRTVQEMLDLISRSTEETLGESNFRHKLSEQIDQHVEILFSKMLRYFKKNKFEKHFPKEVKDEFVKALTEALQELVDVVYALDSEIHKLSEDLTQQIIPVCAGSKLWQEYTD